MSLLSFNKYYLLKIILGLFLICFSTSSEARFGGQESHKPSFSQNNNALLDYECRINSLNKRCKTHLTKVEGNDVFILFALLGVGIGLPFLYIWFRSSRKPPKDINILAFTHFLRERFMLLQTLWDQSDWDKISQYVDRSLIYSLYDSRVRARASRRDTTVIKNLSIYIKGFRSGQDYCEVKVEFSGLDNQVYFKEQWILKREGISHVKIVDLS